MPLHFTPTEFDRRKQAACQSLADAGLDAILLFSQESMYWLTGYDSFGFCFFQSMVLTQDGRISLLTRAPDLRQAQYTSLLTDVRIWRDAEGYNPALDVRDLLGELLPAPRRVGIEYQTQGLTAYNGKLVDEALDGVAELSDASDIIPALRLVKSEEELVYVRRAAELADDAHAAARQLAKPGADEGDILAAMQGAVFKGGGDYAGNGFIIGSGPGALLCRYFSGRRRLSNPDQLTLEFAGAYRQYHAALMCTIPIGAADPKHRAMYDAALQSFEAARVALVPGAPLGNVFQAHATALDNAGYHAARLNACGYSLGAHYAPCWMDGFMFYEGNRTLAAANMVFFIHIIMMDSETGFAMTLGQTVLVTETGTERLTNAPMDLFIGT